MVIKFEDKVFSSTPHGEALLIVRWATGKKLYTIRLTKTKPYNNSSPRTNLRHDFIWNIRGVKQADISKRVFAENSVGFGLLLSVSYIKSIPTQAKSYYCGEKSGPKCHF